MVVGARRASLSISQSGFSRTTISGVYKEWCEKGKNIQYAAVLWAKVSARGQRRMG